jgi:rhodanese-related sulfurtransferase
MKKILIIILSILLMCGCTNEKLEKLPLPEVSEGMRGELGIDKNINESNIDNYLNRSDSVYYDMRLLVDTAKYEAIGGDSYLSGFVKGFEVLPYPLLSNVKGLPQEVGEPYTGETLFTQQEDGTYKANYEESMSVLEYFFPKDKNIFLMCGGGGYAGMTKAMLVSLGWDETKIYNTGGYWYYEGTNNVEVKETKNDKNYYAFWKIPYHTFDFDAMTEVK